MDQPGEVVANHARGHLNRKTCFLCPRMPFRHSKADTVSPCCAQCLQKICLRFSRSRLSVRAPFPSREKMEAGCTTWKQVAPHAFLLSRCLFSSSHRLQYTTVLHTGWYVLTIEPKDLGQRFEERRRGQPADVFNIIQKRPNHRCSGKYSFSLFTPDHEQDWQPYPVDRYSCYMCDDTYCYKQYCLTCYAQYMVQYSNDGIYCTVHMLRYGTSLAFVRSKSNSRPTLNTVCAYSTYS